MTTETTTSTALPNWKQTVAAVREQGVSFRDSVGGGIIKVLVSELTSKTVAGRDFNIPLESLDELAAWSGRTVSWSEGLATVRTAGGLVVEVWREKACQGRAELRSVVGADGLATTESHLPTAPEPDADAALDAFNAEGDRLAAEGFFGPTDEELRAAEPEAEVVAPAAPPVLHETEEGDGVRAVAIRECVAAAVSCTWETDGSGREKLLSIMLRAPSGATFEGGETELTVPRDAKGSKPMWRRVRAAVAGLTAQQGLRLIVGGAA